jgi:hypothetical protein
MIRSRLIMPLFLLALLVSATGPLTAHAAVSCLTDTTVCTGNTYCDASGQCVAPTPSTQPSSPTATGGAAAGSPCTDDSQCGVDSSGHDLACLPESGSPRACAVDPSVSSVTNPPSTASQNTPVNNSNTSSDWLDQLMGKIMSLFAWLLGIAAITLDNAMYYTVVHMGSYINGLSAVGVAWRILRDVGNIVLVFGFIALGITVILDVGWYGGASKMLPVLLIAAVFLNFSLFIAEAVIDTGNLFATEFYTQINGGVPATPQDYTGKAISDEGISTAVMNQLGLQSIYGGAVGASDGNNAILQSGHPFLIGFMAILLFMIAAFVFFSLAFVLIARFVFLLFLIIIAPIGFAGLAVPKLEGTANWWWGELFGQTITAPAMLLMLYVALAVITDSSFLTGFTSSGATNTAASDAAQTAWTSWLVNNTGTNLGGLASAILSFIVAMGLLMAVTMLSKKMGAWGGATATKWGSALSFGLTARAVGATSGTLGLAGRSSLGRASNAAAARWRNSAWGRSPLVGRWVGSALDAGAKSSYDARGTKLIQGAGKAAGVNIGTAQKGGYAATEKAAVEKKVTYGKSLGLTAAETDEKKALEAKLKVAADDRDAKLYALGPATGTPADKRARKTINESYEAIEKDIKRTGKNPDGTIKKGLDFYSGVAQREYADRLEKPLPLGLQYPYMGTVGPRADKKAAKKIRDEANKGQAAKLKDALDGFEKKTAGDGH